MSKVSLSLALPVVSLASLTPKPNIDEEVIELTHVSQLCRYCPPQAGAEPVVSDPRETQRSLQQENIHHHLQSRSALYRKLYLYSPCMMSAPLTLLPS